MVKILEQRTEIVDLIAVRKLLPVFFHALALNDPAVGFQLADKNAAFRQEQKINVHGALIRGDQDIPHDCEIVILCKMRGQLHLGGRRLHHRNALFLL